MHIKDVEQRTGLSRANIRYYEQEGLVHPARRKNGYRDYSPDDLETLLRIRLLRRLDVPIEEIRSMQAGKLSLSEALSQRLAALRRREEQARADQSVCRAMQADHACYDTLDAEKYWRLLYTPPQAAPAAARTDRQDPCPWRRFLARGLDMLLCSSTVALALMLGRIAPQTPGFSLLTYVGSLLLMLGVEPVLLHLWGVTPGKLLLGLTVEQPDGRRPTWGQAYAYTAMAVVYGIALYNSRSAAVAAAQELSGLPGRPGNALGGRAPVPEPGHSLVAVGAASRSLGAGDPGHNRRQQHSSDAC